MVEAVAKEAGASPGFGMAQQLKGAALLAALHTFHLKPVSLLRVHSVSVSSHKTFSKTCERRQRQNSDGGQATLSRGDLEASLPTSGSSGGTFRAGTRRATSLAVLGSLENPAS